MQSKMYDENNTRHRGENWTEEEKDLFLEIMKHSAPILENKANDTKTNKLKVAEWAKVKRKLENLHGTKREIYQLKGFWRRKKIAAKKSFLQYERALNIAGDGCEPVPLSEEDQLIISLCPRDFAVSINELNSNAIFKDTTVNDCENLSDEDVENYEVHYEMKPKDVDVIKTMLEEKEHMTTKPKNQSREQNSYNNDENTYEETIVNPNTRFKKRCMLLIEEEYQLKLKYQREELCHQQMRHKMEIDILTMEKEKKALEIQILKKSLQ